VLLAYASIDAVMLIAMLCAKSSPPEVSQETSYSIHKWSPYEEERPRILPKGLTRAEAAGMAYGMGWKAMLKMKPERLMSEGSVVGVMYEDQVLKWCWRSSFPASPGNLGRVVP
jgi:hypothetical protein